MKKAGIERVNWQWIAALILGVWVVGLGCHGSLFPPSTQPKGVVEAKAPALDLKGLSLEPVLTLETLSDSPSPAFSADGRSLVYRKRGGQRPHFALHQVIHLDLSEMVVREVWSFDGQQPQENYYYDEYGYYREPKAIEHSNVTYHPAILGGRVLVSLASFWVYEDATFGVPLEGDSKPESYGMGIYPKVSPDGTKVLLQTSTEVLEVSAHGELRRKPGFFPVWAPDSQSFLVHMTGYGVSAASLGYPTWPSDVSPPYENLGGLILYGEGGHEVLTDRGGRPTWHPQGGDIVFERLDKIGESWPRLVRYSLDPREEQVIAESGRFPVFHPSGELLFYEGTEGVMVTDFETTRSLGIQGTELQVSADGRFLMVQVAKREKHRGNTRDLVLYELGQVVEGAE